MEVILLEDIANLGKKYDSVEVADGYGMNFLIPQKKARTATERAKAQVREQKERLEEERRKRREELAAALGKLEEKTLAFSRKANEQGSLFAGIDAQALAEKIAEEYGLEIDPDFIDIPSPIKSVGIHAVSIEIEDQSATLTVEVSAA